MTKDNGSISWQDLNGVSHDDSQFSMANQNGVTYKEEVQYSLTDMNGLAYEDRLRLNINNMNGPSC